jgi:hypothetical protein
MLASDVRHDRSALLVPSVYAAHMLSGSCACIESRRIILNMHSKSEAIVELEGSAHSTV